MPRINELPYEFTLNCMEPDTQRFLRRPDSLCAPVERNIQRFLCRYYPSRGVIFFYNENMEEVSTAYIGPMSDWPSLNAEEYVRRSAESLLVDYVNRQHAEREAEQERVRREDRRSQIGYNDAWRAYQALDRATRPAQNPDERVEMPEPAPTTYTLGADYASFEMQYAQRWNSPIPPEALSNAARAAQEQVARQVEGQIMWNIPPAQVAGSDPYAQNEVRATRSQEERNNAFASLYGGSPAPISPPRQRTARRTRSNRPKRRHYLTLMPYINFDKCAKCFNDRDLKLMRVAALRVLRSLENPVGDMSRAVGLWSGYRQALVRYGFAIAKECRRRGFADTSFDVFQAQLTPGLCQKPAWIKWQALRKSHQAYMMLREERRHAARSLLNWAKTQRDLGASPLLLDACRRIGMSQRREWQHFDIQNVYHSFMNAGITTFPPFRSQYATQEGWTDTPAENFIYP